MIENSTGGNSTRFKLFLMITKLSDYNFHYIFSEVGANNTENANSLIDGLLEVASEMIKTKYGDRIKIPDIHEWFSEKVRKRS